MERGQFTFYRSFWEAIRELPAKDKAAVICAVCAYVFDEEAPSLQGTSKAIFSLMKPTLDSSAKKAANGKLGGSKSKANAKQTEKEKEKEDEVEKEGEIENECSPPIKAPPRVAKQKHGQYGWVRLTQEEYAKLLTDLGETELRRCIEYVDEAAQGNGNKNHWKDWNIVIRKCHRDGWGLTKSHTNPIRIYGGTQGGPTKEDYERMQKLLKEYGGDDGETEDLPFA